MTPNQTKPSKACFSGASCLLVLAWLLQGCASVEPAPPRVPPYQPTNFSASRTHLTPEIVRVAVKAPEVDDTLAAQHNRTVQLLEQVYRSEVAKPMLFEVVWLDEASMKAMGLPPLKTDRPYPRQFFTTLKESLQCEAFLTSKITNLRTMAPLMIGWQMKLVDTDTLETIWEINEVFDAGNASVHAAAANYFEAEVRSGFRKPSSELVMASPRLYGQYTLDAVFSTLPPRK